MPWSKDQVQPVDPGGLYPHDADGAQVFEEGPFGITGTAVESRSGDANGQNLRVLGGSGANPRAAPTSAASATSLALTPLPAPGRDAGARRLGEDAVQPERALREAGAAEPRGRSGIAPGDQTPLPRSAQGVGALAGRGADRFRRWSSSINGLGDSGPRSISRTGASRGAPSVTSSGAAVLRRDRPADIDLEQALGVNGR